MTFHDKKREPSGQQEKMGSNDVTDIELADSSSSREGDATRAQATTTITAAAGGSNASGPEGVDTAGYHRRLNKRQIMFMTFGTGIGTGLWVGTGTALKAAGPGGIAVAYTFQA